MKLLQPTVFDLLLKGSAHFLKKLYCLEQVWSNRFQVFHQNFQAIKILCHNSEKMKLNVPCTNTEQEKTEKANLSQEKSLVPEKASAEKGHWLHATDFSISYLVLQTKSIFHYTFTQSLLEAVRIKSFKTLSSSPSTKGPDVQWKSSNQDLGKNKNKKSTWKKISVKRESWEKEEIQQNLSTYSTLHEIKIHALFRTNALKIHINHAEFWISLPSMRRTESTEISVILKVKSEVPNTAKENPNLSHL